MKSIVGQVMYVFMFLLRIHEDKLRARRRGERTKGIYSGKTFKFYLNKSVIFAKWCQKQFGIKLLIQLNEEMCMAFFRDMMARQLSPWTLHSYRTALKWLEKGMPKTLHRRVKIVPKNLVLPSRSLKIRKDRYAYTDEQIDIILATARKIDKIVAAALEVQFLLGLRVSEVARLRVVDWLDGRLVMKIWYGKGGKDRDAESLNSDRTGELVDHAQVGCEDEMRPLFPNLTVNRMCYVMRKACEAAGINRHKTHLLRHSYAEKRYEIRTTEGMLPKKARIKGSKDLGHNRVDVHYSYVPSRRKR